ncbi:MAG: hypothetical protein ABFS03_00780 [Chloroflexota bacterium]
MSKFKVGDDVVLCGYTGSSKHENGKTGEVVSEIYLYTEDAGNFFVYDVMLDNEVSKGYDSVDGEFAISEENLRKKYDGDQVTSWSSLKDIYNPEKVGA